MRSCWECPCRDLLGQQEKRSLRPERWQPGVGAGAEQIADDAELGWVWKTRQSVCAQVAGSDDSSRVSTGLLSS